MHEAQGTLELLTTIFSYAHALVEIRFSLQELYILYYIHDLNRTIYLTERLWQKAIKTHILIGARQNKIN